VLTSDRAKDSAAFGTVSDSLRTLGLSHISGVWGKLLTGDDDLRQSQIHYSVRHCE
jgi:hypothetical protein